MLIAWELLFPGTPEDFVKTANQLIRLLLLT